MTSARIFAELRQQLLGGARGMGSLLLIGWVVWLGATHVCAQDDQPDATESSQTETSETEATQAPTPAATQPAEERPLVSRWRSWFRSSPSAAKPTAAQGTTAPKITQKPTYRSSPVKPSSAKTAAAPATSPGSWLAGIKLWPTGTKDGAKENPENQTALPITTSSDPAAAGIDLSFARDHLVFATGERFSFTAIVKNATESAGKQIRCRASLCKARTETELWGDEKTARREKDAAVVQLPFQVVLPRQEGAYEIRLETESATDQRQVRRIPVVVIAAQPSSGAEAAAENLRNASLWKIVQRINPAQGTGVITDPVTVRGQGTVQSVAIGKVTASEFAPQAYRVYPLVIREPDRPLFLEIDYPAHQPQRLSVAIMEPGQEIAAGLAVDRGFTIEQGDVQEGTLKTHRLVYWPTTKEPWLILSNGADAPAYCGEIRLRSGGSRLPLEEKPTADERLVVAQLEDPCFVSAFSAGIVFDADLTPQADWTAWHRAGDYLTQYLRHIGYNAASFPIVHQGGALYPSSHLPSFVDPVRGTMTTQPSDPKNKDVFEMLLRQFESQGLRCVPSLHLSAGIRELDELAEKGEAGIYLEAPPGVKIPEQIPRYNILNPQVQRVLRQLVAEIVARYGKRPGFAGLTITMTTETSTHLPSGEWGLDATSLKAFIAEHGKDFKTWDRSAASLLKDPECFERWLLWRAERLSQFYQGLAEEFAQLPDSVKLILVLPELKAQTHAAAAESSAGLPSANTIQRQLLDYGLDLATLSSHAKLCVSRPDRLQTLRTAEHDRLAALSLAWPEMVSNMPGAGTVAMVMRGEHTSQVALPQALQGEGNALEEVRLIGQLSAGSERVRISWLRKFREGDPQAIFDGGLLPPLGQELTIRDVTQTLRKLPRTLFRDLPAEHATAAEPVIVRTAEAAGKAYAYLVNPSPWPCRVTLNLTGNSSASWESLLPREISQPRLAGGKMTWSIELAPADFVAVSCAAEQSLLSSYQVQLHPSAVKALGDQLGTLQRRIASRESAELPNPSFEALDAEGKLLHWRLETGPKTTAEVVPGGRSGTQELRMTSLHPAGGFSAVASTKAIPVKAATRFAAGVWIRNNDEKSSPIVRLSLEAKSPAGLTLKSSDFGTDPRASRPLPPLTSTWSWHQVAMESLPAGATEVRFHIVLRNNGDVSLDDAALFDYWLTPPEQSQLQELLTEAKGHFQQQRYTAVERLLGTELLFNLTQHQAMQPVVLQGELPLPSDNFPPPNISAENNRHRLPGITPSESAQSKKLASGVLPPEFERLPPTEEPLPLFNDELPLPKASAPTQLPASESDVELINPAAMSEKRAETVASQPNPKSSTPNWFQRLISPLAPKTDRTTIVK